MHLWSLKHPQNILKDGHNLKLKLDIEKLRTFSFNPTFKVLEMKFVLDTS